jgi:hypothetical protein
MLAEVRGTFYVDTHLKCVHSGWLGRDGAVEGRPGATPDCLKEGTVVRFVEEYWLEGRDTIQRRERAKVAFVDPHNGAVTLLLLEPHQTLCYHDNTLLLEPHETDVLSKLELEVAIPRPKTVSYFPTRLALAASFVLAVVGGLLLGVAVPEVQADAMLKGVFEGLNLDWN